jgi:Na+/melibiose symporter-like transporter
MPASDDEETLVPLLSGSPSTTPPRPPPHPTTTTTLPTPPPKRRLPFLSQLLFSFPALSLEALHVFHHTWITKFFVDDVKFPALSFAVLHATERSLGIISYPFMGLLVDRTVLPKQCPGCSGRRRVFFLLWAPLLFVAYLFIWVLPCQLAVTDVAAADAAMHALNSTQLSDINVLHNLDSTSFMKMEPKYFGFIAVAYMVGHFLKSLAPVDLPWMSLGAETTKVTIDRTHLFATKSVVSLIGLGVGSVGPVLLLNNGMVDHFTAFSKYICITGVMLVFSFWLLASRIVPATAQQESKTNMEQKCGVLYENSDVVANGGADSYRQTNLPFVAGIVLCFDNMPYMRLWCVHGLQSLGDVLNEGNNLDNIDL